MDKQKFWKIYLPIGLIGIFLLFIGLIIGIALTVSTPTYQNLNDFCEDRQYKSFSHIERWVYEGEETLSIICQNKDGEYSFAESIPVYNEVFNRPT